MCVCVCVKEREREIEFAISLQMIASLPSPALNDPLWLICRKTKQKKLFTIKIIIQISFLITNSCS